MQELEQKIASISQELALFQMNELQRDNELEKRLKEIEKLIAEFQQAHTSLERLGTLEDRVKTLEEARLRQISLNSTFAIKEIKENKPDKKLWDWLIK